MLETYAIWEFISKYRTEDQKEISDLLAQNQSLKSSTVAYLGIGALSHDTSAALVDAQGRILLATTEERHSNVKHDSRFPVRSIVECLSYANKHGYQVKGVGINFDSSLFLGKLFRNMMLMKLGEESLANDWVNYLQEQMNAGTLHKALATQETYRQLLGRSADAASAEKLVHFYYTYAAKYARIRDIIRDLFPSLPFAEVNHHRSHALSTAIASGYDKAIVSVIDGHGEYQSVTTYRLDGKNLDEIGCIEWPTSIGSLYLLATRHLGFDYGDEFKVMGMSAYGHNTYAYIFDGFATVTADGFIFNNNKYLNVDFVRETGQVRFKFTEELHKVLAANTDKKDLQQEHFDFAFSVQTFVEGLFATMISNFIDQTGIRNVALSGGVALNGLANNVVRKLEQCDQLYIFPASGDDGTSVGAAQHFCGVGNGTEQQLNFYAGTEVNTGRAIQLLEELGIPYTLYDDIHAKISEELNNGMIVARCTGRAEFGPRALGHRSIMADPSIPGMKDVLNLRIKQREKFRPFAPACLLEDAPKYFDLEEGEIAPFMILIVQAKEITKQQYPEIVHNDGTGRVQTLIEGVHADFHRLVSTHKKQFNKDIIINTSFNVNGEAIVDDELDTIESFLFMDIDFLALNNIWIAKKDITKNHTAELAHQDYLDLRKKRYDAKVNNTLKHLDCRKTF